VLAEWVAHDNRGRPHASLGPGIPAPADDWLAPPSGDHRIRDGHRVVAKPVLGGHYEYRLERSPSRMSLRVRASRASRPNINVRRRIE